MRLLAALFALALLAASPAAAAPTSPPPTRAGVLAAFPDYELRRSERPGQVDDTGYPPDDPAGALLLITGPSTRQITTAGVIVLWPPARSVTPEQRRLRRDALYRMLRAAAPDWREGPDWLEAELARIGGRQGSASRRQLPSGWTLLLRITAIDHFRAQP